MRSVNRKSAERPVNSPRATREDHWRRRQALQVAAQLPDEPEEALTVLRHAQTLVRSFLAPHKRAR
jgi:hypothetical protein